MQRPPLALLRETTPAELDALLQEVDYPPDVALVIEKVLEAVSSIEGARVFAFGSAVNGFSDGDSDIDLVVSAPHAELRRALDLGHVALTSLPARALDRMLRGLEMVGFQMVESVLHAKVPILKLDFGGRQCDLSCNNLLPLFNTQLLRAYAKADPRVVDLTNDVKRWARAQGVQGAPAGHLSSYSFTLLVIFYMQVRGALPCFQQYAERAPRWYVEGGKCCNVAMDLTLTAARPEVEITLQDFASFYCSESEFTWGDDVVSVRAGRKAPKRSYPDLGMNGRRHVTATDRAYMIDIEDPFDLNRNLNYVFAPGHNRKLWFALRALSLQKLQREDPGSQEQRKQSEDPRSQEPGPPRWQKGNKMPNEIQELGGAPSVRRWTARTRAPD